MAFHGDLFSFPLPELLQWLDSSRKTGNLHVTWEGGERKLFLREGQVFASSGAGLWERTARVLKLARASSAEVVFEAFQKLRRTGDVQAAAAQADIDVGLLAGFAREELYGGVVDLTLADDGQFHWSEDSDTTGEEWLPLELSLRALVFEALRWVDEAPEVDRTLPTDAVLVKSKVEPAPEHPLLYRAILAVCKKHESLGQLRLTLGLSKTAGARRVFDLLKLGLVEVEGMGELKDDPLGQMLEKGLELVRQKQFDAASLVFSALLQADPADRRVREFARMVEAEHIADLYRDLPPLTVLTLNADPEALRALRQEVRQVASLVNGSWDISTLTLASPAKELDTLKSLHRLWRMGLVAPKPMA